jgi:hypothetical protein
VGLAPAVADAMRIAAHATLRLWRGFVQAPGTASGPENRFDPLADFRTAWILLRNKASGSSSHPVADPGDESHAEQGDGHENK